MLRALRSLVSCHIVDTTVSKMLIEQPGATCGSFRFVFALATLMSEIER